MFSRVYTASIFGLDTELSCVEVNVANGLPKFLVVGLANQAVKEASDRIRAAVVNCGLSFPDKRVTVNLTPANVSKTGSHFDLPIAVGLLFACGQMTDERNVSKEAAFIGELSLDGRVNGVDGILPMIIGLQKRGIRKVVLPKESLSEAMLCEGMDFVPVAHLSELKEYIEGKTDIKAVAETESCQEEKYPDFAEIRGQAAVKRAAQIAAAGAHGMLMIGPPGVGKSMVGKRIPGILPPMSYSEKMDITQVYSIAGELNPKRPVISQRPFRAPHHSMSSAALIGGGAIPKPGEISLAHNGVLFLDELPEFSSHTIDMLRQPMEDGMVAITRANGRCVFPSSFMLVAAMNPCRCGYFGDPVKACTCTDGERLRYLGRISGPLLDRIDIHVVMERVVYNDMVSDRQEEISSEKLRNGVERAFLMQQERYKELDIARNSELTPLLIKEFCRLDKESDELMRKAFESLDLSARSYHRILKVARTIADVDEQTDIKQEHLLEALNYRKPEKFFG